MTERHTTRMGYHADARDVIPDLPNFDLVLTDPPYGIDGSTGSNAKRGKSNYLFNGWQDGIH